jgi:hypothetical protein
MWVPDAGGYGSRHPWLRQPVGYRVIARDGPLGSLARIDEDPPGAPAHFAIREGLFVRRLVRVPARALLGVVPQRRRIFVDWRRRCD